MPALVDHIEPATVQSQQTSRLLAPNLGRSAIAAYEEQDGFAYVVVTAEPLRVPAEVLFEEVDSEFGICVVIRLSGALPAIGVIRQVDDGFREYWRSSSSSSRAMLRRLRDAADQGEPVPVFWRLADGSFAQFQLWGSNRQHGVWYSRLDLVDDSTPRCLLGDPGDEVWPSRYGIDGDTLVS